MKPKWQSQHRRRRKAVIIHMVAASSPKKAFDDADRDHDHATQPVKLLCIDISNWVKPLQFFVLCLAVFFFYLVYGYIQELVFRLPGMKPFGWYLTLVQFAIYTVLSYAEMKWTTGIVRRIPWHIYFQIAFYTVATMGLSNASLGYLNYPTQVIFKCCKLIPVLVGGILIQGKRYAKCRPISISEKAMKGFNASNDEMVLFSYSIGFCYIFVGIFLSGQLSEAFLFFAEYPIQTYGYTFLIGVVGYFGVNVVLTLVRTSGALVAVTVTTMRKAVTIVFSFYFFSKPFTLGYVWGGLVVLLAIYLNVYAKNKKQFDAKLAELWSNFTEINNGRVKHYGEKFAADCERKLLLQVAIVAGPNSDLRVPSSHFRPPQRQMASSPLALFAAFLFLLFPRLPLGIKCLNCRTTDEDALVCDFPCEGDICALWRYREMSTNLRIQGCLSGPDLRSPTSRLKMGCRRNGAGAQLCLCRDVPLCNADIGHGHSSTETADSDAVQQVMPADIRCQSHTSASFITRQFVRPPRYGCHSDLCFLTETNISRPSADDPLGNSPRIDSSISQSCGAQREFNFDLLLGSLWPGNGLHSDACYQLEDGRSSILGCSCSNNDCNQQLPYPIDSTQKRVKCHLERPLFSSLSSNSPHANFCHGQFCFVQRMPYDGQLAVNSGCLSANESAARTSLKSGYRNILGVEQWLCEENFCNLIIVRNGEEQTTGEWSGGTAQKMRMKTTERPTNTEGICRRITMPREELGEESTEGICRRITMPREELGEENTEGMCRRITMPREELGEENTEGICRRITMPREELGEENTEGMCRRITMPREELGEENTEGMCRRITMPREELGEENTEGMCRRITMPREELGEENTEGMCRRITMPREELGEENTEGMCRRITMPREELGEENHYAKGRVGGGRAVLTISFCLCYLSFAQFINMRRRYDKVRANKLFLTIAPLVMEFPAWCRLISSGSRLGTIRQYKKMHSLAMPPPPINTQPTHYVHLPFPCRLSFNIHWQKPSPPPFALLFQAFIPHNHPNCAMKTYGKHQVPMLRVEEREEEKIGGEKTEGTVPISLLDKNHVTNPLNQKSVSPLSKIALLNSPTPQKHIMLQRSGVKVPVSTTALLNGTANQQNIHKRSDQQAINTFDRTVPNAAQMLLAARNREKQMELASTRVAGARLPPLQLPKILTDGGGKEVAERSIEQNPPDEEGFKRMIATVANRTLPQLQPLGQSKSSVSPAVPPVPYVATDPMRESSASLPLPMSTVGFPNEVFAHLQNPPRRRSSSAGAITTNVHKPLPAISEQIGAIRHETLFRGGNFTKHRPKQIPWHMAVKCVLIGGDHPTARDQCGESQRRSPLTSDPVSPPPPPGRLYPNIVPPGTVQQSEKSFLFEVHKRLDNDPLPPQQQQQQQQQQLQQQQLQQQQLQQQQLQQQQQQQQQQQHAGPAGRAGEGVGVRYLVHGLPQTQQFHAVHAVPSGSVNNAGAPLSSFPNGVQRISGIFVPYRRRLSYASVTLSQSKI
uniref:Adenosine 3'-phospho 5'-phosphosulfate transporter 2 n=1 Tax=Globodera rostochiensis TaxID=31243 RepID=A0A914HEK6_GLORO